MQDGDGPYKAEGRHHFLSTNLHHVKFFVSFIPTGAAFADLDGNGLFDEFCTADPFSGRTRVFPAPTRGEAFEAFEQFPMPPDFSRETAGPTGCIASDFNRDGTNDLLVYFWGRSPVLALNRDTDGRRERGDFESVDLVSPPQVWYTHSAATGDVDGDGALDLVFAEYMDGDMRPWSMATARVLPRCSRDGARR